jgi:hypothetical protein
MKKIFKILILLIVLIFSASMLIGNYNSYSKMADVEFDMTAKGIVKEVKAARNGGRLVCFYTNTNIQEICGRPLGINDLSQQVNDIVVVSYSSKQPNYFYVNNEQYTDYLFPLIFLIQFFGCIISLYKELANNF